MVNPSNFFKHGRVSCRNGVVVPWKHGSVLRIGTDDAENLAPFRQRQMAGDMARRLTTPSN
jgi:hypothetical protein